MSGKGRQKEGLEDGYLQREKRDRSFTAWGTRRQVKEREMVCAIKEIPAPSPLLSVSVRVTNCGIWTSQAQGFSHLRTSAVKRLSGP